MPKNRPHREAHKARTPRLHLTKETFTTGSSVSVRKHVTSADERTCVQTDFDGVVTTITYDMHGAIVASSCTEPDGTTSFMTSVMAFLSACSLAASSGSPISAKQ